MKYMKKFIYENWEKVILLLALALFVANYINMRSISEDVLVADAVKVWEGLRGYIDNAKAEPIVPEDYPAKVEDVWQPPVYVSGVLWANDKFTAVKLVTKDDSVTVITQPKSFIVPQVSVTAQAGSVKIEWAPDPDSEAVPSAYIIYRADGSKPEEELVKLPGTDVSFIDKSARPNSSYQYKLAVITEDMNVLTNRITTPVYSVATVNDFYIKIKVSPGANLADPTAMVGIEVFKYIPGQEEPESEIFFMRRNKPIGKPESKYVKDKNGKIMMDPVTNEPMKKEIDFTTGYTLQDIYADEKGNEYIKYLDEKGVSHELKR